MNSLFHFCQGESHKSTEKPCQDCAYAESTDSLSMAIVSDGHGGERYFRSQFGSKYAVEIAKEAIRHFVTSMAESSLVRQGEKSVFAEKEFTSFSKETATDIQIDSNAHQALMWLFSSIISQWNEAIAKDAHERELTGWENSHVEQKYKDEFLSNRANENATFEKTYGCTLMAYVQTPSYWFAFHLGDGKCVMMQNQEEHLVCSQPIPWDERCFLNKTTSMCDSQALDEFRYCYQGDGTFPLAVFLGSDGMDDSYGDGDNLNNFYIELFKIIIKKSNDDAKSELIKSLPKISKVGSKDDMSVTCIYEDSLLQRTYLLLTDYQKEKLEDQYQSICIKVETLQKKIASFGESEKLDKVQKINYNYACNDLKKSGKLLERLKKKMATLKGEVTKFKNKNKE